MVHVLHPRRRTTGERGGAPPPHATNHVQGRHTARNRRFAAVATEPGRGAADAAAGAQRLRGLGFWHISQNPTCSRVCGSKIGGLRFSNVQCTHFHAVGMARAPGTAVGRC